MSAPYQSITSNAPLDGRDVQLIDVYAETPAWGVGFYMVEYGAFFGGYRHEYEEMLAEIEAGEATDEDLDGMFWAQPTHWAEVLPIPSQ